MKYKNTKSLQEKQSKKESPIPVPQISGYLLDTLHLCSLLCVGLGLARKGQKLAKTYFLLNLDFSETMGIQCLKRLISG